MKIAFVVQRYGQEIIGGAESHARQIALRLAADYGWQVHIYTTAAKDYLSWRNTFAVGMSEEGPLTIWRFPTLFPRFPLLFRLYNRIVAPLLKACLPLSSRSLGGLLLPCCRLLESLWYVLQGPYCPRLIQELKKQAQSYDKVFFFTYLYYPTAFGLPLLGKKSVLIPTAHDEAPFYFRQTRSVLSKASLILANCDEEKALIQRVHGSTAAPIKLAGVGVDHLLAPLAKAAEVSRLQPLPRPYILFLGRLGKGKGVGDLISAFIRFQEQTQANLHLVLAGEKDSSFLAPSHPRLHFLGPVNEEEKRHIITHASVLVNPSRYESLALIVLEALVLKVPVLVNGQNPVLRAYACHSPSVFTYQDSGEFSAQLSYLLSEAWQIRAEQALATGQAWVLKEFAWGKILATYKDAAHSMA